MNECIGRPYWRSVWRTEKVFVTGIVSGTSQVSLHVYGLVKGVIGSLTRKRDIVDPIAVLLFDVLGARAGLVTACVVNMN